MRCLPAVIFFCLLLSVSAAQAAPLGGFTLTVPPVPRSVPGPPEYLLTPPVPPGIGPVWRAAQENALREAAFRYLFSVFPASAARNYHVVYLSLGYYSSGQGAEASKDPDAALLKRFQNNVPPVQAVSALPASHRDWHDSKKHHWIVYRVSSLKWADDTHVQINCGNFMSGYISSDSIYIDCALRNGWWTITGITYLSI